MIIHRIQILPSIKYSYQKVWEDRYFLLKVSWLCLLLEIVFSLLLDEYVRDNPFNAEIDTESFIVPFRMPYENFLFYAISIVFSSIVFVRYYQFLLISDGNIRGKLPHISINPDRKINLPYYFEFNKNIIFYALFTFLFFSPFIILEHNFSLIYFSLFPEDIYGIGTYITAIKYYIFNRLFAHNPIEIFLMSSVIFVWPYFAVKNQYSTKDLKSLFVATKGNLLPIFITVYLLTMVLEVYFYITGVMVNEYLYSNHYSMDTVDQVNYILYIIGFPINYVLVFTQITFMSLIYKKLVLEGKKL